MKDGGHGSWSERPALTTSSRCSRCRSIGCHSPGGSTASQTDLFVLARRPQGPLVALAVEGKVDDPFGAQTAAEWRSDGSPGKQHRLAHLRQLLALPDDQGTGQLA